MKYKLAVLLGAIVGALLLVGPASATSTGNPGDQDPSIGTVVPGSTCSSAQANANQGRGAKGEKGGEEYRCRKDNDCYRWKYVYNPHTPKSGKTAWPHPTCPCASTTPTASPSASPTPTHTPTVVPTTPPATATPSTAPSKSAGGAIPTAAPSAPNVRVIGNGTLPVTGSPLIAILSLGGALVATGILALLAARARSRRTTI